MVEFLGTLLLLLGTSTLPLRTSSALKVSPAWAKLLIAQNALHYPSPKAERQSLLLSEVLPALLTFLAELSVDKAPSLLTKKFCKHCSPKQLRVAAIRVQRHRNRKVKPTHTWRNSSGGHAPPLACEGGSAGTTIDFLVMNRSALHSEVLKQAAEFSRTRAKVFSEPQI